jgi:3-hydroxybutyryl-CoA dehydrogenase
VGVVGAGAMGSGIASVAARAGHQVVVADADAGRVPAAIDKIEADWRKAAARGRMEEGEVTAARGRLTAASSLEDLGRCGLVVEAIIEDLTAKVELFSALERLVGDDAVLATNTSSLSVNAIGAALTRPERFAGLHFFNPVPAMRLVEVVSGLSTADEVAAALERLMPQWGKTPVRCASTPGFIVNRVARPFYGEGFRALAEGLAAPEVIDAVVRDGGGFRMGPLELADLIGHDVNRSANRSVWSALGNDPWFRPSLLQDELVAAGRLGHKTGRGFYDHEGSPAQPVSLTGERGALSAPAALDDPVLVELVEQWRERGLEVGSDDTLPGDVVAVHGVPMAASDGRTALQRSQDMGVDELLVLDAVAGVANRKAVGVTSSADHVTAAVERLAGALSEADIATYWCADVPGLVLSRTVAMLVNLAVEAASAGVASAADIGLAMRTGVNYPQDLFAWGDMQGVDRILTVLDTLQLQHQDGHFRPCAELRRIQRRRVGLVDALVGEGTA